MNKTYILQKDLPDGSKVGDEYSKPEPSYSYTNRSTDRNGSLKIPENFVENNPEWFKEKPLLMGCTVTGVNYKNTISIDFKNGVPFRLAMDGIAFYSEKEFLEAEEKAFKAGREGTTDWFSYTNFSEYKNKATHEIKIQNTNI